MISSGIDSIFPINTTTLMITTLSQHWNQQATCYLSPQFLEDQIQIQKQSLTVAKIQKPD